MTRDFAKKYELIKSVIEYFGEKYFTIKEIYILCDVISRNYNLVITMDEVKCVVANLYDSFEIDRIVTNNNIVCFKNNFVNVEENIINR